MTERMTEIDPNLLGQVSGGIREPGCIDPTPEWLANFGKNRKVSSLPQGFPNEAPPRHPPPLPVCFDGPDGPICLPVRPATE